MADLIDPIQHYYCTELFEHEAIVLFVHILFEKYLSFCGFSTVSHLVDIYAKKVDEGGRNFMCKRTLPSLRFEFKTILFHESGHQNL